jgi:predicted lysophospholipase L1 biosynthesis ABC-type transport system permease subunit
MAKTIQDLMRCGLIKYKRGPSGGYTRVPEQIRKRRLLMKPSSYPLVVFFLLAVALAGCEAIGDIFKAGVWTGVILVILVIGVIVWLLTRSKA